LIQVTVVRISINPEGTFTIKTYLTESLLPPGVILLLSDIDPEAEVVVLSVCGAGFGIVAVLSEVKISLDIEFSVVPFFEQLMMNRTLIVKNNFFIIIYF